MELLYRPLPLGPAIAGWIVLLPLAWLAARRALPELLRARAVEQHAFLAAALACGFLWSLQIEGGGTRFAMLGGPLVALVCGRERAVLALLAALAGHMAFTAGAWINAGVNGLLLAALPAWLVTALQRQIEARLPRNLFVFIIGSGLAATLVTAACTALALQGVAVATIAPAAARSDTVAYALLLSWAEALVSGMIFSSLVIFVPQVVRTYRQDLYLPERGG